MLPGFYSVAAKNSALEHFGPYFFIIAGSVVLLLSFFFNKLSAKTSIPSVLMLIGLGVGLQYGLKAMGIVKPELFAVLELLGIVGLIIIVLEGALELKLTRDKVPMILKSAVSALLGLVVTAFACAWVIQFFLPEMSLSIALLYATTLSILSSAVVIPSVNNLRPEKKEFLVYESTLSDIFGVMMFYFILSVLEAGGDVEATAGRMAVEFGIGFVITIIVALVSGYVLITVFQRVEGGARLFSIIAVLLLLYSIGKLAHLSPLIIILIFGLMVANPYLFFRWKAKRLILPDKFPSLESGMHVLTVETAFAIRTFFFVVFGANIVLNSLVDVTVLVMGFSLMVVTYCLRSLLLRLLLKGKIIPHIWVSPRGLITIMLFYSIPESLKDESFNSGVLLLLILGTGIIMMLGLFYNKALKHPLEDGDEPEVESIAEGGDGGQEAISPSDGHSK